MKSKIYNKKKEYVFQELPIQYFIQVFEQQFLTKRKILLFMRKSSDMFNSSSSGLGHFTALKYYILTL